VPGWGSMMGFALFIMLEDEYGCKITPDEFRKLKFVSDLISVVPEFDSEK
jgi:acyl carrier protein